MKSPVSSPAAMASQRPVLPLILAVSGASGAPYARNLLKHLVRLRIPVELVVSEAGARLIQDELGATATPEGLCGGKAPGVTKRSIKDIGAAIAWGGLETRGMVILPCSMGRIGSIAAGLSQDLMDRAAAVTMKEGRKLVLVPREAPIGVIHLEAMATLARAGAVILPASPGFYTRPKTLEDLLTFMTVKLCRVLGIAPPDAPGYTG